MLSWLNNDPNGFGRLVLSFGIKLLLSSGTNTRTADFVWLSAILLKTWSCSCIGVDRILFGAKLAVVGRDAVGVCCFSRSYLCFVLEEVKSISQTGMYGTCFTYPGIIQDMCILRTGYRTSHPHSGFNSKKQRTDMRACLAQTRHAVTMCGDNITIILR